jgi:hypothetical protein
VSSLLNDTTLPNLDTVDIHVRPGAKDIAVTRCFMQRHSGVLRGSVLEDAIVV